MSYFPAKEIVPGLWIGSEKDAMTPEMTRDKFVVNCTPDSSLKPGNAFGYEQIRINDHPTEHQKLLDALPVIVREIDEHMSLGKQVLVHCRAGMQRSASVVAAYLMFKRGYTWPEAKKYIQSRKTETFRPYPTFDKTLKVWESLIRKGVA